MPVKLMFEGLPVREPSRSIVIIPTRADKKAAKRGDPACCVAAKSLKRTHQLDDVRVYRSRVLTRPKGKSFWNRYEAPANLSEEIRIFDKTGEFSGKQFTCPPLHPTKRSGPNRAPGTQNGTKPRPKKKRYSSPMAKLRGSPAITTAA